MYVTFQKDGRLAAPAGAVQLLEYRFDRDCLAALRGELGRCGRAHNLGEQALFNFVLAINEITTNAARHAYGRGRLRLWRHDDVLWCEVSDNGPGISRAMLEQSHRRRPGHLGGHGLWLARQIFDSVGIETSRSSGTRVLLGYPLPAPAPSEE
jgi:anti-sigma regulatory factor (Ser/Thr protein kinase)